MGWAVFQDGVYTAKTGTEHLYVKVPDEKINALKKIPLKKASYLIKNETDETTALVEDCEGSVVISVDSLDSGKLEAKELLVMEKINSLFLRNASLSIEAAKQVCREIEEYAKEAKLAVSSYLKEREFESTTVQFPNEKKIELHENEELVFTIEKNHAAKIEFEVKPLPTGVLRVTETETVKGTEPYAYHTVCSGTALSQHLNILEKHQCKILYETVKVKAKQKQKETVKEERE